MTFERLRLAEGQADRAVRLPVGDERKGAGRAVLGGFENLARLRIVKIRRLEIRDPDRSTFPDRDREREGRVGRNRPERLGGLAVALVGDELQPIVPDGYDGGGDRPQGRPALTDDQLDDGSSR